MYNRLMCIQIERPKLNYSLDMNDDDDYNSNWMDNQCGTMNVYKTKRSEVFAQFS